jgi:hypothetical protein
MKEKGGGQLAEKGAGNPLKNVIFKIKQAKV